MISNLSLEQKDFILQQHHPTLWAFLRHHRTHNDTKATLRGYPYLKQMFFDNNKHIVIESSTQNGKTEFLIVNAIMKASQGRGVFYVLPTFDIRNRFVNNRFNRTLDFTKYYTALMHSEKEKTYSSDSASLKHFGKGSIAFIGSNSPAAFTEFPADDVIIDELDRCDQGNIGMAQERLSNSRDPRKIFVSNPTIKDFGIDYEYNRSDKKKWYVRCDCGEWLTPNFFDHVVKDVGDNNYVLRDIEYQEDMQRDIYCICPHCGSPFNRFAKGKWIAENKDIPISGYQINKLFSSKTTIKELCDRFNIALMNPTKMERFYNADLGEAYTAKGAKIDFDMLDNCRRDYFLSKSSSNPCIIGIDVGSKLHVVIGEILPDKKVKIVFIDELEADLQNIALLFKRFHIKIGCVDAMPEQMFSKKLCNIPGMFMCYMKDTPKDHVDPHTRIASVNRTVSLDVVKEEILLENVLLPKNADVIAPLESNGKSSFYNMMCNSVRLFDEEKQKYKWVEGSKKDHFLFAMNYLLIAKKIFLSV